MSCFGGLHRWSADDMQSIAYQDSQEIESISNRIRSHFEMGPSTTHSNRSNHLHTCVSETNSLPTRNTRRVNSPPKHHILSQLVQSIHPKRPGSFIRRCSIRSLPGTLPNYPEPYKEDCARTSVHDSMNRKSIISLDEPLGIVHNRKPESVLITATTEPFCQSNTLNNPSQSSIQASKCHNLYLPDPIFFSPATKVEPDKNILSSSTTRTQVPMWPAYLLFSVGAVILLFTASRIDSDRLDQLSYTADYHLPSYTPTIDSARMMMRIVCFLLAWWFLCKSQLVTCGLFIIRVLLWPFRMIFWIIRSLLLKQRYSQYANTSLPSPQALAAGLSIEFLPEWRKIGSEQGTATKCRLPSA